MSAPDPADAATWTRARTLFEAAVGLPRGARRALVEARTADDPELRAHVLALLDADADEAATAFLEEPVASSLAARVRSLADGDPAEALVGTRLGRYVLRRVLGRGGMGVVYLAEQREPVRRQVAIKVIRPGLDGEAVLERFRSEEQALALMRHPSIAAVLDGATSDDGRPYFVMEYVPGVSLPLYCDRHRLRVAERLRLFAQVCDAVHHAHQKGVIHRDLKASNVLVQIEGDRAIPKVIDFGIARACTQGAPGACADDDAGTVVGTPEYMSPEQAEASALDVDTRTDVYALGVVLYELVAGRLPFAGDRLRASGVGELRRILRDEQAPAPSAAALAGGDETAHLRGLRDARALSARLRGDLDAIIAKATAKDRTRRYASASELAADLERHLSDEPVLAVAPSPLYAARKFVRRHRGVTAVAVLLAVALVASTIVALRAMHEADLQAQRSEREALTSRAALGFLRRALATAAPASAQGRRVSIDEVLEHASALLDEDFDAPPEARAAVLLIVGSVFASLGEYADAELHVSSALLLSREAHGGDDPQTMEALTALATIQMQRGDFARAIALAEDAYAMAARLYGKRTPAATRRMNDLALVLAQAGLYERAEPLFRELLSRFPRTNEAAARDRATALTNLSWVRLDMGALDEAEALAREAATLTERLDPRDHPRRAITYGALARALLARGALREADVAAREALRIDALVYDAMHPLLLGSLTLLGRVALEAGRLDEAGALLDRADAVLATRSDTPPVARAEGRLVRGRWLLAAGRPQEAIGVLEEAARLLETSSGPRARDLATVHLALAQAALEADRPQDAARPLDEARRARVGIFGAGHAWVAEVDVLAARARAAAGDVDGALGAIAEPLARLEQALGAGHPDAARARLLWADWMLARGRGAQAAPAVDRTLDALLQAQGPAHPLTARAAAWRAAVGS